MVKKKMLAILVAAVIIVIVVGAAGTWYFMMPVKQVTKPIKIGHLADLTGIAALYGYSESKIARAAVSLINSRGGTNGRPVELYVEDTQSESSTGITKMNKLIDYWDVDFVMADAQSGVTDSILPLAKQYKVVTFAFAGGDEITSDKGNRFVFRLNRNTKQDALAAGSYGIENLGKKWTTFVVDITAGQSSERAFSDEIKSLGGTILKSVRFPSTAVDMLPYVKQIPAESDAVMLFAYPDSFTMFMQAFRPLYSRMPVLITSSQPHGFDIPNLPSEMEGLYHVTSFPLMLNGLNTSYNVQFRQLVGMDGQAREIGNSKNVFLVTYDWSVWESFFALKMAIEKSGWQSRADNAKVIQALEGLNVKESFEFPQGDLTIRAEDHQGFPRQFIERLENKTLKTVAVVPSQNVAYPPPADYRKESLSGIVTQPVKDYSTTQTIVGDNALNVIVTIPSQSMLYPPPVDYRKVN